MDKIILMDIFHQNYLSILLLFIVSVIFATLPLVSNFLISFLVNKNNPRKKIADLSKCAQAEPYECGANTFSDARFKFPIKFVLIAILFIIFDLELIFLFPWAVIFSKLTDSATLTMGIFLLILTVGFIYEWKKGALNWE